MEDQPHVRKKWSERQFELFADVTKELGPQAPREEFERLLDHLLNPHEPKRKRRKGNGSTDAEDDT
jgi:hypothetical protein